MVVEKRKIADLRPAEYNPRQELHPGDPEYENIARSIKTFGYVDPIIINKDNTIIGGHQRARVLADLGYTAVDVVVLDVDKTHEKALNVALNKITGNWDENKLKDLLLDLDDSDLGLDATGFTKTDLDDLVGKLDIPPEAEDDGFDPDSCANAFEPVTCRGDIWALGKHRLMCGDCTDPDDMAELMDGMQADLIETDPPYNVDYGQLCDDLPNRRNKVRAANGGSDIENDKMEDSSFYDFLLGAFGTMAECARPGAAAYIFHADTETVNFRRAMEDSGFKISEGLVWEKNAFVLGRQDYQWRHEPILYGWKKGAGHYFVKDRTQDTVLLEDDIDFENMKKAELVAWIQQRIRDSKDFTTVFYENNPPRNDLHPTMKPVELVGKFIANSSKPGWIVLDPFAGSGSTIIAAEQLGRTAYAMELEPKYCDVIVRRWEDFTGKKAVRV